jgi:hypothetical protein
MFFPIQKHPNFDGDGDSSPVYERYKCILISPSPLGEREVGGGFVFEGGKTWFL